MNKEYFKFGFVNNLKTLQDEDHRNLFILGTAGKGPINQPIRIKNLDDILNVFGTEGTLYKCFLQINTFYDDINSLNIYMVKISGKYAKCNLDDRYQIQSVTTDKDITGAYIEVIDEKIIFNYPKLNLHIVYKISERDIIRKINSDITNPSTIINSEDNFRKLNQGIYKFNKPISGIDINKNEHYCCLRETFEYLEGIQINNIICLDAYVDDTHPSFIFNNFEEITNEAILSNKIDYLSIQEGKYPARFYRQLQLFCKKQLLHGINTHGIIGFSPNNSKDYSNNYIEKVYDQLITEDFYDEGFTISVTAGDVSYFMENKFEIIDNLYIAYAVMLTYLPVQSSPTNQQIPNGVVCLDDFDTDQINNWTNKGITTYRHSILLGDVISNGVTFSKPNSKYFYVDHIRVASYVIYLINKVLKQYIGEQGETLLTNKTFVKSIENVLIGLRDEVIEDYSFSLNLKKGLLEVLLELTTIKTLQVIKVGSSINITNE